MIPRSTGRIASIALIAAAIAVVLAPGIAAAQRYDLDFTLPTAGKSGCLVCHGDANLVRLRGSASVSYFVDENVIKGSAHADVPCTGCHVDFAFKAPHRQGDWRRNAKLSCKNCHEDQFQAYGEGVHSISVQPGQKVDAKAAEKPLCGDCHGSHSIEKLTKNPEGARRLHARGYEVCGKCHQEYWDTYDDYYHGAAYRKGAPDAPACWQCHGAHDIHKTSDKRSKANEVRLVDTCGECHRNIGAEGEAYTSYGRFVHTRRQQLEANPVYSLFRQAGQAISGFFGSLGGLFT